MRKIEEDFVDADLMRVAVKLGFDWECLQEVDGVPLASVSWLERWLYEEKQWRVEIVIRNRRLHEKPDPTNYITITNGGFVAARIQKVSVNDTSSYGNHTYNGMTYSNKGDAYYASTIKMGRKAFPTYKEAFQEGLKKVFEILEEESELK